jgi:hypothetical protein
MAVKTYFMPKGTQHITYGNGAIAYSLFINRDIAMNMMGNNEGNRSMKKGQLSALGRALTEEKFIVNGDTIRFDVNGRLIDGQHRLNEVIHTDVGFWALVVEGLSVEAADVIDVGVQRRLRDSLARAGYDNTTVLEGGIILVLKLQHLWANDNITLDKRVTIQEGMAWIAENPEIKSFRHPGIWIRTYYKVNFYCGLGFLFRRHNPESMRKFFRMLQEDVPEAGHPMRVLHDDIMETRKGTDRMQRRELLANSILAFNALDAGKLKGWTRETLFSYNPEHFPRIGQ